MTSFFGSHCILLTLFQNLLFSLFPLQNAAPSKITSTFKKASICSKKSTRGLKVHLHQFPIQLDDSDSNPILGNSDSNSIGNTDSNEIRNSDSNELGNSDSNPIGNSDSNPIGSCKKCSAAQPCGWHHSSNALWRELENSPFNKRKNKEVA